MFLILFLYYPFIQNIINSFSDITGLGVTSVVTKVLITSSEVMCLTNSTAAACLAGSSQAFLVMGVRIVWAPRCTEKKPR